MMQELKTILSSLDNVPSSFFGKVLLLRADTTMIPKIMTIAAVELSAESKIILIDNSSRFQHHVSKYFKPSDAKKILSKVLISKPFTPYQFRDVIKTLPRVIVNQHAKVLMISSLKSLFGDMPEKERTSFLDRLLSAITHITIKEQLFTLIFEHKEYGEDKTIDPLLEQHAHECVVV